MPARRSLRGDIAEILNPMVREGQIAGFRTNLQGRAERDDVVVIVTVPEADSLDTTQKAVSEALSALPISVMIQVDLP